MMIARRVAMVAVCGFCLPSHAEEWLDVELPALDKDEILLGQLNQVNADSFPRAITQEWDWTAMSQADLMHHALPVLRAGADLCGEQVVEFHGELICDFFPFYLSDLPIANAYTDGRYIYITAGMVRELKSIDEYRAVIGHEIGHILSGHVYKRLKAARRAALWGAVFGGLLSVAAASQGVFVDGVVEDAATIGAVFGSLRFSQQFELEADYIGAYLLARSGASIEAAKQMWRRWGTGEEGTWLSFHPTGAERFALLSATENETEEKREGQVAIVPNKRGSEKPSTLRYFSAALDRFDSDDNGRITCREARQHGIAPRAERSSCVWLRCNRAQRQKALGSRAPRGQAGGEMPAELSMSVLVDLVERKQTVRPDGRLHEAHERAATIGADVRAALAG